MSEISKITQTLMGGDTETLITMVIQTFADEIGADGYAPDAGSASRLAKAIIA